MRLRLVRLVRRGRRSLCAPAALLSLVKPPPLSEAGFFFRRGMSADGTEAPVLISIILSLEVNGALSCGTYFWPSKQRKRCAGWPVVTRKSVIGGPYSVRSPSANNDKGGKCQLAPLDCGIARSLHQYDASTCRQEGKETVVSVSVGHRLLR